MSAHSEFNTSDAILGVGWNPQPGTDRAKPPMGITPWEVRMIEQGWRIVEACLSLGDELPDAIRTEIAQYERLEDVWYGEMQQSPVWPQGADQRETGGEE